MNNQELDALIHHALIDSIKNYTEQIKAENIVFSPTAKYRKQIKLMLSNPLKWAKNKINPIYVKILRTAAMIAITVSIAFGCLMTFSPSVRAIVKKWVLEIYEQYFVYRFYGDDNNEEMQDYEIKDLPDGYTEYERNKSSGMVHIVYRNNHNERIYLRYVSMTSGGLSSFVVPIEEQDNALDVSINNMEGKYFQNPDSAKTSTLIWMNQDANLQFILDATLPYMDIMHIGCSVSLCNDTKN